MRSLDRTVDSACTTGCDDIEHESDVCNARALYTMHTVICVTVGGNNPELSDRVPDLRRTFYRVPCVECTEGVLYLELGAFGHGVETTAS